MREFKTYSPTRYGVGMQMFDSLPPRLRAAARENPDANVGFILVALDDGMSEDEIIDAIRRKDGWLTK